MRRKITYSRYGRIFAKPARVSKSGRKQIGITPRIISYCKGISGKNKLEKATEIVYDIASFEMVGLSKEKAERLWARRSADDVIKTKKIYIDERTRREGAVIGGCIDYAETITACLRQIRLKAVVVRANKHSYAKFLYKGEVYIADVASPAGLKVRKITTRDKNKENILRKANAFAEGASFAQIGLNSFEDFSKYAKKIKKR